MFERYTEKARRTIFFARKEASNLGSPYIETEHLLLGLLNDGFLTSFVLQGISVPPLVLLAGAARVGIIASDLSSVALRRNPQSVNSPLTGQCALIFWLGDRGRG
jgi:hypothetical protein